MHPFVLCGIALYDFTITSFDKKLKKRLDITFLFVYNDVIQQIKK